VSAAPWTVRAVEPGAGGYRAGPWSVDWAPERHRDRVLAVRRSIAAGDTYRCNLTTRLTGPVGGDLARFYADLAHRQRGRYNAFLDLGRFVVASASPELFFELRGRRVLTRPMKGTAARGATPDEDDKRRHRLRHSAKDRAEKTMIVDLIRNDLARVARTGTVEVTALCRPERYETVHQLTSEVAAELRPDVGLLDLFRALFPSGSVTGAPKASTMRLITEREQTPRGGITWDSDPDDEYAELLTKARILEPAPPARQMS
jgi:para-aminobenzoate synthetase/4-amino-4-deoxychorismate lyase